jgi:translation initiation factor IF-3
LERIIKMLESYAVVENAPTLDGRHMTRLLGPAKALPSRPAQGDTPA